MAVTKNSTADKKAVKDADAALAKDAEMPAATEFSTSGAPVQRTEIDPSHPAIDDNPRKGTSIAQNMADMNDPTLSEEEAVAENLKKQGVPTKTTAELAKDS